MLQPRGVPVLDESARPLSPNYAGLSNENQTFRAELAQGH